MGNTGNYDAVVNITADASSARKEFAQLIKEFAGNEAEFHAKLSTDRGEFKTFVNKLQAMANKYGVKLNIDTSAFDSAINEADRLQKRLETLSFDSVSDQLKNNSKLTRDLFKITEKEAKANVGKAKEIMDTLVLGDRNTNQLLKSGTWGKFKDGKIESFKPGKELDFEAIIAKNDALYNKYLTKKTKLDNQIARGSISDEDSLKDAYRTIYELNELQKEIARFNPKTTAVDSEGKNLFRYDIDTNILEHMKAALEPAYKKISSNISSSFESSMGNIGDFADDLLFQLVNVFEKAAIPVKVSPNVNPDEFVSDTEKQLKGKKVKVETEVAPPENIQDGGLTKEQLQQKADAETRLNGLRTNLSSLIDANKNNDQKRRVQILKGTRGLLRDYADALEMPSEEEFLNFAKGIDNIKPYFGIFEDAKVEVDVKPDVQPKEFKKDIENSVVQAKPEIPVVPVIKSNDETKGVDGNVSEKGVKITPDLSEFKGDTDKKLEEISLDKNVSLIPDISNFELQAQEKLEKIQLEKNVILKAELLNELSREDGHTSESYDINKNQSPNKPVVTVGVEPKVDATSFVSSIQHQLEGYAVEIDTAPQKNDSAEFISYKESKFDNDSVKLDIEPNINTELFLAQAQAQLGDASVVVNVDPNINFAEFKNLIDAQLEGKEISFLNNQSSIENTGDSLNKIFSDLSNKEEILKFLHTLKDVCEDLYLLKDEGSVFDKLSVSKNNVSNIENLAYAIELLKDAFNSFDDNAKNALDSIASLSGQSEKLKDLYNVLREANKASKETKYVVKKEVGDKQSTESVKNVDELGESYKNLTSELKEYINLSRLKALDVELYEDQAKHYETLKTEIENAKNGVETYASAVDEANKYQKDFNKNLNDMFKKEGANSIETLRNKLLSAESKQESKTPEYSNYIKSINADISELSKKLPLDFTNEEELHGFYAEFNKILTKIDKHNSKEFIPVKAAELQNMSASFETWVSNNSNALKNFGDRINEIRSSFSNILTEADKDKLKTAISELRAEVARTGAAGRSMFDMWKQRAKSFVAYLGTYVGFQDILQKLREGFEIAKMYDTQLTEMKKVSDETMASLKEFQQASFALGDSVGTTGQQIQASTADFMRLGESLDEASRSALDANTLFKVSEFGTIDEATEALISMSQAYQELEKSEINDIANHIGNNFAISTQGIAEGLQISAATLKAAGNDIYEAVALLTAGDCIAWFAWITCIQRTYLIARIT